MAAHLVGAFHRAHTGGRYGDVDQVCQPVSQVRPHGIGRETLNSLLGPERTNADPRSPIGPRAPPPVIYAHLKFMWASGARIESLSYLQEFTMNLAEDLGVHTVDEHGKLVTQDGSRRRAWVSSRGCSRAASSSKVSGRCRCARIG